ncbi:MAG: hypothetical protein H6818_03060 [Phycisphaerales bacterium]|nr:hypothetical protein [Phycisphaerales bacterium]
MMESARGTMYEFDVEIESVQRPEFDHDLPAADPAPKSIPSLTKMLVLAHQIHRAVESSRLTDYAEIARQIGVSRARVSQIIRLRMLAPEIQEVILCESDRVSHICERVIRAIPIDASPAIQWHQFSDLLQASD